MKITKAFDVVAHGKQYEIRVEDDSRARCFALVDGTAEQELAKELKFSEAAWRIDAERCLQAEIYALPILFVPALCSEMPEELARRPAEELLVFRNEVYEYDIVIKAGKARSIVEAALERRRVGAINVGEAAFLLARQDGASLRDYRTLILAAFREGLLHFVDSLPPRIGIDAESGMAYLEKNGLKHPGYLIHDEWAFTTPADVNRWLDGIDQHGFMPRIDLRLPLQPSSSPDRSLLATRQQLIEAQNAPTSRGSAYGITHTTKKKRTSALNAVITKARSCATDGADWLSVWNELVSMAKADHRPAPLLGYTEGEGVKYQTDKEEGPVAYLTRDAFRKRFRRAI